MSNYSGALEDANKVLLHLREPYNPGALIVKGDALYHMGMFEHSLVSYYRAARQPDLLSKFVHLSYRFVYSPSLFCNQKDQINTAIESTNNPSLFN